MNMNTYTGLPAGTYCNVIKGCATDSGCEGGSFVVNSDGNARIVIPASDEPILAIDVGTYAKIHLHFSVTRVSF